MKINVLAIGQKMPDWVLQGVGEYQKRLPPHFQLTFIEIPLQKRAKNCDITRLMAKEARAMLDAIPENHHVIALTIDGRQHSTESMAEAINKLQDCGQNLTLLVGGPEGLHRDCLKRADTRWSLSGLTFPHPLVRIILAESIYRVWTVLTHHPYHK